MVFIESAVFTRRLFQLVGVSADEVLREVQTDLLEYPERGNVVKSLGGVRKARTPNPIRRKSKKGGFRYLFLYLKHRNHIHLLLLLDKNEQEDATTEQRADLRRMVEEIKRS